MAETDRETGTAPVDVALEVWEQQPTESATAYEGFKHYRDSDPAKRSLRSTGAALDRAHSTIANWSGSFGWTQRVRAYDANEERIRLAVLRDEGIKASRRHAQTVQVHILGLGKLTAELLRRIEKDPEMLKRLPDQALIKLATAGARATPRLVVAERLALGLSSENVGGHDGGPLADPASTAASMSDAELDAFLMGAETAAALQLTE